MTTDAPTDAPAATREGPLSGVDRWLRGLPCVLLVAVALHQVVLAHTVALAPWSGGGFGMFATTDSGGTRHLHAFVLRPGLRREITATRLDRGLVRRALTLPTERNFERLAAAALQIPTNDHGPPSAVELQVGQTRHDPHDRSPESLLLRAMTIPVVSD